MTTTTDELAELRTANAELRARLATLEQQWDGGLPGGHDGEFEYTISADCDGSNVRRFRRRPALHVPATAWEPAP